MSELQTHTHRRQKERARARQPERRGEEELRTGPNGTTAAACGGGCGGESVSLSSVTPSPASCPVLTRAVSSGFVTASSLSQTFRGFSVGGRSAHPAANSSSCVACLSDSLRLPDSPRQGRDPAAAGLPASLLRPTRQGFGALCPVCVSGTYGERGSPDSDGLSDGQGHAGGPLLSCLGPDPLVLLQLLPLLQVAAADEEEKRRG